MRENRRGQQNRLRVGRHSQAGRAYHVTFATHRRKPVFRDFRAARQMIHHLKFATESDWASTFAFVVMPDHVHWLFALGETKTLGGLMQSVKGFSSRRLVQHGVARSPVWQPGYVDHAIRKDEDLVAVSRYIVANPIRAGICDEIGDYPHWDAVWLTGEMAG